MPKLYTVGQLAQMWNIPPTTISVAFYQRVISDSRVTIIGGRRLIPEEAVEDIRRALVAAGKLQPEMAASA